MRLLSVTMVLLLFVSTVNAQATSGKELFEPTTGAALNIPEGQHEIMTDAMFGINSHALGIRHDLMLAFWSIAMAVLVPGSLGRSRRFKAFIAHQ